MRKRKIPQNMPRLDLMPDPVILPKWTANIILRLVTKDFYSLSEEERELLIALVLLIRSKFDPNDYEIIFRLLSNNNIILSLPANLSSHLLTPRKSNSSQRSDTPNTSEASNSGSNSIASGDLSTLTLPKKPRKTKSQKTNPTTSKTNKTPTIQSPLSSQEPQLTSTLPPTLSQDAHAAPLPELTAEEYLPFTFD